MLRSYGNLEEMAMTITYSDSRKCSKHLGKLFTVILRASYKML